MNQELKEKDRMELQIEQLITIVANLNERLNRLEDLERARQRHGFQKVPMN